MAPHPNDLFLNLWSREIHDEDSGLRPGTEMWESNQLNAQRHWTKVWIQCKELCRYIEEFDALNEKCREIVQEPPEETK